jgi:hypothetical protein
MVSHPWCEHFYRLLSSRCDTEKGGRKGKGHRIDTQNEVQLCSLGLLGPSWPAQGEGRLSGPPPLPHTPPRGLLTDLGNLAQS